MIAPEPINERASTKTLVDFYQRGGPPNNTDRNRAFIVLTYRFRGEVLKKCEIICKRYGHDLNTAEVVANRTFEAYARKGKFDEAKGKGTTYDESFLLYLLRIAERELTNHYRETEKRKKNPYDGTEQIYSELPTPPRNFKLTIEMEIEKDIINKFSIAHRTIYLTYTVHQRQGFKMPRKLLTTLREHLGGIKQDTVNAYLKDVRDAIKNAKETYQLTEKIKGNGK